MSKDPLTIPEVSPREITSTISLGEGELSTIQMTLVQKKLENAFYYLNLLQDLKYGNRTLEGHEDWWEENKEKIITNLKKSLEHSIQDIKSAFGVQSSSEETKPSAKYYEKYQLEIQDVSDNRYMFIYQAASFELGKAGIPVGFDGVLFGYFPKYFFGTEEEEKVHETLKGLGLRLGMKLEDSIEFTL